MHYCNVRPNCFKLRSVTVNILRVPIFRSFTVIAVCVHAFYYCALEVRNEIVNIFSVKIFFLNL